MPQVSPQAPQIAPAADTRPVTQRRGGGFADLLDTLDAKPQDRPRDVEPAPRSRDRDADDVEPVETRRRADHAGRRHAARHETRSEPQDAKTGTNKSDTGKTESAEPDQAADVSATEKPKEQDGKDTPDNTDAAIDPQAVTSVQAPDVRTGMIEAAVAPAPAPAETADTPVLPVDSSAEIEAPQKAAPQMPGQAAAPQAPEADAAPEEKKTADAVQPAKKNEAALPQTRDTAQAADTKSVPQAAKDIAALNPPADDAAKAAQPAPKPERPVMPDASAMRADNDAKPAGETQAAKRPDTLENALARQFGLETKSADPAPVTLTDAARAAQNNFTPASVTVQTSASAATNQPVPLQAAALAIEIAARARDGMREFQIRLDPPELGRVDVKLNVDKHGQVNTHLTVDRPETLDLLRRDAQSLERALQQSGLKTSDGNLEFSLRQQTPDGFNQRHAQQQNGETNGVPAADSDTASSIHAEYQWAARLRGGVDIRV